MDVVVHLNHLAGGGTEEHAEALLAAVEATLAVRSDPIAELSITFTTDEAIAELNQTYLQRPGPTDVLAFRLDDDPVVGDVYISAETASANADRFAVPLREELLRLVIHGTLHLLGHDHPEDDSRQRSDMFRLQESLVDRLLKDLPQR